VEVVVIGRVKDGRSPAKAALDAAESFGYADGLRQARPCGAYFPIPSGGEDFPPLEVDVLPHDEVRMPDCASLVQPTRCAALLSGLEQINKLKLNEPWLAMMIDSMVLHRI
jgi:hypothetical protein